MVRNTSIPYPAASGYLNIQDYHIRLNSFNGFYGIGYILCVSGGFHSFRFGKHAGRSFPYNRRIIYDKNFHDRKIPF